MTQLFTSFSDFKRRYPIRPNDTGALLGSGSYGRVFRVEDQLETEWVAIKISEFKGNDTKSLKAEVELAQRVPRQGNIARYDACYRLETDTSVSDFAIMKYYPDGNLADLLQRNTLTPTQIYDITQGILLGLQHLHRNRIVHRDFKPANILISRDNAGRFIPKIADFGLSRLVTDEELDNSDFDLSDGRGTPSYKAPEQIEGSRVSFNLDLWAFGVILYEILTGEKPFRADHRNSTEQSARREIEKKIISVELPTRIEQIAEPYASMIRRCLVRGIHQRVRKESELLDLLDAIPQLLAEAHNLASRQQHEQALPVFERVLAKREHHAEAEKGAAQCRAVLGSQHLNRLLTVANDYAAAQRFEQAKATYEQVLQLDPAHTEAGRGLAQCVNQLRSQPVAAPEPVFDGTDLYHEPETTDVYPTPVVSVVERGSSAVANQPTPVQTAIVSSPGTPAQPTTNQLVIRIMLRIIPWWVLTPVAASLGVLFLYYQFRTTPVVPTNSVSNGGENQTAGIVPAPGPVAKPLITGEVLLKGTDAKTTPEAAAKILSRRIDVAMDKARSAYAGKDYESAIMYCKSALFLDPGRQDVAAFLLSSEWAEQKPSEATAEKTPPVAVVLEATNSTSTESVKPAVAVPDEKEKAAKEKREQQTKYDQLIDDGIRAIASGNNKAKAIAEFNAASALAKEHNLSTAKADGAYSTYLSKANKIFDSDEYEGAKGWYKVAQALKDTLEVRNKIKQCTNQ